MKKSIIFILLTVLILGIFTACNGDVFADLINGGSEPVASKVTITFKANGGTGDDKTQEITSGVETKLNINEFTAPPDKVFAGWTTDADGEEAYYGDEESVTLTEDLTLYAQWGSPLDPGSTTTWGDGKYTLVEDVTISSDRINVNGNVKLFIPNGKTLTASSGITVTESNSLTINGNGSLIAGGTGTTLDSAAGIGGVNESGKKNAGTITINGGTVIATGDNNGAGIGGGDGGVGGNVTITGGTVTAKGGEFAAGIGGGCNGAGGTISISGGDVEATGGLNAAGIGGGVEGDGGTVTINNGTVTATGVSGGAGIGGGVHGNGGTVTITGGTVTANGGEYAAGIGGGYGGGNGGNVTIEGGTVTATGGGYAAGIGGGFGGAGADVIITGGTVTATGGSGNLPPGSGAGIGRGYDGVSDGTLTIGENSTTPYTDGKLRIASGWVLYYGESSASTSIGEGTYDSWSDYAKKYMNVTQP